MRSLPLSSSSHAPSGHRRWRWALALSLGLSWGGASQAQVRPVPLPAPLAEALQASAIPPEAVSLLVIPVDGGPPRLQHLSQTVRPVASVMKLFTTGVALRTLGPAWTWRTDVALGGPLSPNGTLDGPLYVRGSGDPSLLTEQVHLMLSRWRGAGLKHIRGDIVLDRQAFDVPPHDPYAFDGKGLRPYNAGPDALLFNHQAITLRVMPDAARPGQLRVSMEPELDGVELDARLTPQATAACGDWREALDLQMAPIKGWHHQGQNRWQVRLRGPYPLSCGEKTWPVLWQGDGQGDLTERMLSASWQQLGGQLSGRVTPGSWPAEASTWQTWTSPPLATVVRDINKFSNNVMARQLFLTLGAPPLPPQAVEPTRAPALTLAQARVAVASAVREATATPNAPSPCAGDALVLDNGAGLSRMESSTAQCLGRWLQVLWTSPVMPDLLASLPLSGVDGTTRRWQGAVGQARVKTGSLDGVAAVAGYVDGDSGRRHIVVGVVQHPRAGSARPVLEALLNWARQDL